FPVSNLLIPIGVLIAERTLYLPSAALAFGIVAAAPWFARGGVRAARPAVAAVFAVALGLMISRSVVRTADWKSTNAIFSALVRDRPDNFRGRWHFARLAVAADQPRLALKRYSDAMAVWPHRHGLVIEAAVYASNRGFLDYTHQLTGYALEKWPDDLIARRLHAGVLLDRADTANAYRHILAGLQYHPQDSLLNAMRRAAEPGSDDAAARLVP